jgi:hypothetical protein
MPSYLFNFVRKFYYRRHFASAAEPLHRILGVGGFTIHDVINDAAVRGFVRQEWKFLLRIQRETLLARNKRDEEAKKKYEASFKYWRDGVLPPWAGGPCESFSDWWKA